MAFFENLELLPEDPILDLPKLFERDVHPQKVNLGVGAYRDATGSPYILTVVREAERALVEKIVSEEYLPIEGDPTFIFLVQELIFGENHPKVKAGEVFTAQSLGGTGALRLGGEFLKNNAKPLIFLSDPSWPNHIGIFSRAGLQVDFYKYYDNTHHRVDFAALLASVKGMPSKSAILLQACCHNPTGMDLSLLQWQELSDQIKKQQVIPFFDFAYQGFGKDIDEDAKAIRYFVEQGHEVLVASSNSKNFGLYGERVGSFSVVTSSKDSAIKSASHIKQIIRGNYSNPPRFGAQIVSYILQSPDLKKGWKREVQAMRERVSEMREALAFGLESKGLHRDFSYILDQKGMFSFSGLNQRQVLRLREERGVYMIDNGRMNVAGLNPANIDYVMESLLSIL